MKKYEMKISRSIVPIVSLAGMLVLSACGKQEAPSPAATPAPAAPAAAPPAPAPTPVPAPAVTTISSVVLGNALGADGKVDAPSTSFAPKDTIYAVVATNSSGQGSTALSAKWTYAEGQLVNQSNEAIATNGPATTTFHISKPDGFPVGKYKVEISIDGKTSSSTDFEVK